MSSILFSDVIEASKRIDGVVLRTPVVNSPEIDEMAGRSVFMKCENLQLVGAFKFRGATNAVKMLGEDAALGLCTHSSGNHGQAVALAAKQRGVPAYIVMPNTAPKVKVNGVRSHGAEVVFCEPNLEARVTTANSILDRTGATFIHPFDNSDVIAGQGTAAKEMIEECGNLDAVLSPIGGGGLMSGTCISTRALLPDALLFGTEPEGADDAARSLESGEYVPQTDPDTICDGLLTSMGEITWPIIKSHVEEIIRVSDEEVLIAMTLIHEIFGMVVEPSGAISLAAVLKDEFRAKEGIGSIGIILCGGNVDPENLPFTP
ncbi:MAG TPA: pyridoxal-phosphate dependent enzyme [Candidatus Poseidoniales archaeon]|jgi:threonine dehydratase|nr:MAG: serine dehydratase [Euryarchaeota archaeon]HIG33862.1 pyridoxal-phosphate dependent enzyme [Candidatus Poseidoniales archaeon]HIL67292.1 pyridoxal-phosphate dependent enzyme [Candidatus Poseidoniales archaeon]